MLHHHNQIGKYNNRTFIIADLSHFPDMAALCHWHEDVEILYVTDGHMSYHINGTIITLRTGDAIIVNSRQMHFGFSADKTNAHYLCIVFSPALVSGNEYVQNQYIFPITENSAVPYTQLFADDPRHQLLLSQFPEICSTFLSGTPGFELSVHNFLSHFWLEWYRLLQPHLPSMSRQMDQDLLTQKRMVGYIYENYQSKLQLSDIAAAGSISRTKCCQIFKKYFQKTPMDFLNTHRLSIAMQLLASSSLSVTEIALSCGFCSSSYFTEVFVRQKGITPTEYRREVSWIFRHTSS